jgi:general secretion pathway protein G
VSPRRKREDGLTFLEMIAATAILMILASAVFPVLRIARTRRKEIELHADLRTLRVAIDRFHMASVQGMIGGTDLQLGNEGYPKDLDLLVKGVNQAGKVDRKLKFLRQIPPDPMTGAREWGLKCYQDEPDSHSWCGENVWDVYSKSSGKALDGTYYKDW